MKLNSRVIPFALLLLPRTLATLPLIYISPVASLLILIRKGYRLSKQSLILILVFFLINAIVISLNQSHFKNFALAIASYGSIFLLAIAQRKTPSDKEASLWQNLIIFMALFQGAIGVAQLFYNGFPLKLPYRDFSEDFFVGTLGTGGNRVVANMLAVAIVLCFFRHEIEKIKYNLAIMIFLSACLLMTSSNMSLITMAAAYGITCTKTVKKYFNIPALKLSKKPYRKTKMTFQKKHLLLGFVGFLLISGFVSSGGYKYFLDTYQKWVYQLEITDNARYMSIFNTFTKLPIEAPYQPFFGVGIGNYSSWAQMTLSEDYIRVHIIGKHSDNQELIKHASQNPIAYDNVLKYLSEGLFRAETESVINQPYFSWQSLYAETGIIGLSIIFLLILPKLRSIKLHPSDSAKNIIVKKTLIFYTVFLALNGFIDNYFEYPWMTLPYFVGLLSISNQKRAPSLNQNF